MCSVTRPSESNPGSESRVAPAPGRTLDLPSVGEMYALGYRARRTGKFKGEVIAPAGTVFRLKIHVPTCSCCPEYPRPAAARCAHINRFTALLCLQRSVCAQSSNDDSETSQPAGSLPARSIGRVRLTTEFRRAIATTGPADDPRSMVANKDRSVGDFETGVRPDEG